MALAKDWTEWQGMNPAEVLPPIPRPDLPAPGPFVITSVETVVNWARKNSLWPLVFGTSCCAIEMMQTGASRHDWSRFGFEVARASPRQADLIVVAGTICFKMATRLRLLYEQMPEPKWVLAMGACTVSGGPFYYDSYSVVKGVDKILPVDVYLPGCPPRPEALIHALLVAVGRMAPFGSRSARAGNDASTAKSRDRLT